MNIILDINECPSLPHPEPYSGVRTSMLEIQEFIQKTVKLNKQPIVVFGANWCPDARLFEGVIQLPVVKSFLERNANILNMYSKQSTVLCILYFNSIIFLVELYTLLFKILL